MEDTDEIQEIKRLKLLINDAWKYMSMQGWSETREIRNTFRKVNEIVMEVKNWEVK